jgi:hypothetical protein
MHWLIDRFSDLRCRFFTGVILKITYGVDLNESNNSYLEVAEETLRGAAEAAVPGAFLVDLLPLRV